MEIMYNDEGQAFVPAHEIYKGFIFDQLNIAVKRSKEDYIEVQRSILERLVFDSEFFNLLKKEEKREAVYVLGTEYETMKRWLKHPEGKHTTPKMPNIKLVK